MDIADSTFGKVKAVLVETLGIEDRADSLTPNTALLDGLAEFDSMAVLNLIIALEKRFDVVIDGDEVSGELFETLGTLTAFVEHKLK